MLRGTQGAASHKLMRRYFASNKKAHTEAVKKNMAAAQEGRYDPDDARRLSARNHLCGEVPIGNAKTLGYLGFGIALIWDHLLAERHDDAMDVASRLLVCVEQAALDHSNFDVAWPLTHLPEPPWARLRAQAAPGHEEARFATLSDPSWVTTTMALKRDLAMLAESRKRKGKGKGDDKDKDKDGKGK